MLYSFNFAQCSDVLRPRRKAGGVYGVIKTYGAVCYITRVVDNRKKHGATRKHLPTIRIPVRWGDMDAYGHVNNTVYFRYFEQVRVEWLEQQGGRVRPDEPVGPVIINASCTFLAPVNYPSTVVVKMYGGKPGRTSLMTWYEVFVEGEDRLYAEGAAKTVWMDMRTGRSAPLPEAVRALFD